MDCCDDIVKNEYYLKCPHHNHSFPKFFFEKDRPEPEKCKNYRRYMLCGDDNCEDCFRRSFASHCKAQYWCYDKNKNITCPRRISKNNKSEIWFKCDKCPHHIKMILGNVYKNHWCKFCSLCNTKLCEKEDCTFCFNKSFASSPMVIYYSEKNKDEDGNYIDPITLTKGSGGKYKFICNNNHEFEMRIYDITSGHFCSLCRNKTEQKLYETLCKWNHSIGNIYKIKRETTFKWCKDLKSGKSYCRFDIVIENEFIKIIIELDGRQHFEHVGNWDLPEEIRERDFYKMYMANKYGYTIIRISQIDVWNDRIDWFTILTCHIHLYQNPCRIYIAKEEKYYSIYRINDMQEYYLQLINLNTGYLNLFESYKKIALVGKCRVEDIEFMVNNNIVNESGYKIIKVSKRKIFQETLMRVFY